MDGKIEIFGALNAGDRIIKKQVRKYVTEQM